MSRIERSGDFANKRRRLRHTISRGRGRCLRTTFAYVTRRASTEPCDSPADGGERGAEVVLWARGGRGEVGRGVLVSKSGHLVELSRKPTAEQ